MDTTAAANAIAAAITTSLDQVADTAYTDALHDAIYVIRDAITSYSRDSDTSADYHDGYLDGLDDAICAIQRRLLAD